MNFGRKAESGAFDDLINNPAWRTTWNARHHSLMMYRGYPGEGMSWYNNMFQFYVDAYIIYGWSGVNDAGDDWQTYAFRDMSNNPCKMYSGGPDYAGDFITKPLFRQHLIDYSIAKFTSFSWYKCLYIDDSNLHQYVSPVPKDPDTGQPYTAAKWKTGMRNYLDQWKTAFAAAHPTKLIAHNTQPLQYPSPDYTDADLIASIDSCNYVLDEFGFQDGNHQTLDAAAWAKKHDFRDLVHSRGRYMLSQEYNIISGQQMPNTDTKKTWGLANFFLSSDTLYDHFWTFYQSLPNVEPWPYTINLANPKNNRYLYQNVWRRDFANGFVLANPPGSPQRNVDGIILNANEGYISPVAPLGLRRIQPVRKGDRVVKIR